MVETKRRKRRGIGGEGERKRRIGGERKRRGEEEGQSGKSLRGAIGGEARVVNFF